MELKPLSSLMIRLLGRRQHVAVFVVLSLILYVGSSGFQAYVSFLWSGTGTVAVDGTGESELQDRLASFLERPALDHRDMAHASEFGCKPSSSSRVPAIVTFAQALDTRSTATSTTTINAGRIRGRTSTRRKSSRRAGR